MESSLKRMYYLILCCSRVINLYLHVINLNLNRDLLLFKSRLMTGIHSMPRLNIFLIKVGFSSF